MFAAYHEAVTPLHFVCYLGDALGSDGAVSELLVCCPCSASLLDRVSSESKDQSHQDSSLE